MLQRAKRMAQLEGTIRGQELSTKERKRTILHLEAAYSANVIIRTLLRWMEAGY